MHAYGNKYKCTRKNKVKLRTKTIKTKCFLFTNFSKIEPFGPNMLKHQPPGGSRSSNDAAAAKGLLRPGALGQGPSLDARVACHMGRSQVSPGVLHTYAAYVDVDQ